MVVLVQTVASAPASAVIFTQDRDPALNNSIEAKFYNMKAEFAHMPHKSDVLSANLRSTNTCM